MLAAPGSLPDGGDWVVEFAWEGLRCLAHVRPDRVRLRTANGRDVTSSFPELVEPLTRRAPRGGMVLDGTVVAVGEGGLPRRRQLQRRTASTRPSPAVLRRTPVGFVVGDLLWLAGRDLVDLPYRRRRELLEELGLARPPVVVSPTFPVAEAEAVMRTAEEYGAEALHARHLDAPYRPGRRPRAWLRVPLRRSGLVVVGGWNPAGPAAAGPGRRPAARRARPRSRTRGCATWAGSASARGRSSARSRRCWPGSRRPGVAVRGAAARSRRPRRAVGGPAPGRAGGVHRLDGGRAAPAARVARPGRPRPGRSAAAAASPPHRTPFPSPRPFPARSGATSRRRPPYRSRRRRRPAEPRRRRRGRRRAPRRRSRRAGSSSTSSTTR